MPKIGVRVTALNQTYLQTYLCKNWRLVFIQLTIGQCGKIRAEAQVDLA